MHWGLALRNFVGPAETPDVDALYAYAERAEALGFESLWAWDHVILGVEPAFPILDAVGVLTAIAARTRRIRLGTGRSEERRVGKSVDVGGRRIMKKKKRSHDKLVKS